MLVVLCHAVAHPFAAAPDIAHLMGRVGVTLFFVISGFIMVATTSRGDGRFDPLLFMRKRITRVVPLYYTVTLLVLFLTLVTPAIFKSTPFDLKHVVTSLLFIPSYTPDTGEIEPFYKLGWTLNYEMFFYVVFASLFWMRTRARTITIVVLFSALFLLGLVVRFENPAWTLYTRTDVLAFAAGAVVGTVKPAGGWRMPAPVQVAILAGAVLGLVLLAWGYGPIRTSALAQIAATAICTAIVAVLACHGQERPGPVAGIATLLGNASYAIYLFHMFAVGGTWWLVGRVIGRVDGPTYALVVTTASVGAVVLGIGAYRYLEGPMARAVHVRPAVA
ncbi:MAG: acetyltransferase protein [Devosia sp.]|nr:acetyltransferase protein [Devosia sp.]